MAGKQAVYEVFTRFRIDAKGWDKSLNRLSRSMTRTGRKMTRAGQNLTRDLTLPLSLAGGAAVKFAVDLEQSFAKIQNLVGISTDALKGFSQEVRRISESTGEAQKSLADALFVVTSAGERGAEAIQILEQASRASAAGLGNTAEIARTVTAVLQAYGKENITAARATDVLFSTVREGNLEAESLANALGPVLGLASKLGISFEEVGANIATFTRLGVSAEQAATSLQAIFTTFLKPTEGAKKALAEFGLTAQGVRDSIEKKGLANTLIDLTGRIGDNDEALAEIIPNIRALRGVLGTAGVQAESYSDILQSIANNTDLVNQGFENVSQTAGQKFKVALTQLQNVAIELGNVLIPILVQVVEKITSVINWFRGLSNETKKTIVQVALLVAAIGPMLFIFGKITIILGTVVKLFTAMSLAMVVVAAKVLAIVAAIAALIVIGISLYKNWENIKNLLVGIMERMILGVFKQANLFVKIWERAKAFTQKIVKGILVGIINFVKGFTNVWSKFVDFLGFDDPIEGIADNLDKLVDRIQGTGPPVEKTASKLEQTIENLQKKVDKTTVKGLFFDVVKGQVQATKDVIDSVKDSVQNLKNSFLGLGGGTGSAIVNPVGGGDTRKNALSGLTDISNQGGVQGVQAVSAVTKQLGIDMLVVNERMRDLNNGFIQQSERGNELAQIIGGVLSNAFSGLGNAIISGFENGENALQSFGKFFADFAKGLVAKMITLIATAVVLSAILGAIGFGVGAGGAIKQGVGFAKSIGNVLKGGLGVPALAKGTNYVNSDGMAYLHRGEQVVPANVAGGGFGGGGQQLVAVVKGSDLNFILSEYDRKRNNSF